MQVLQIIPESMFGVLHQIITILTDDMKEVSLLFCSLEVFIVSHLSLIDAQFPLLVYMYIADNSLS